MHSHLQSSIFQLKIIRNTDEKLAQANELLKQLIDHFYNKAAKSKRYYTFYKYSSIVLTALATIITSLQIAYKSQIPQWILPVVSAAATVMVAFLGASSAQKIWINSRTTQQRFQAEQILFNQQTGRYKNLESESRLQLFSERLIDLWNEGHGKWEQNVGND